MEHISKFLEKHKVNVECQCEERKKYKVEFTEVATVKYCIDVLAKDEEEAKVLGEAGMQKVLENGTYHYHETDRDETVPELSYVFDVSGTDDPFDAINS